MLVHAVCLVIWVWLGVVCFYYTCITPHPNDLPFCAAALYFWDHAWEALKQLLEEFHR